MLYTGKNLYSHKINFIELNLIKIGIFNRFGIEYVSLDLSNDLTQNFTYVYLLIKKLIKH